MYFDFTNYCEKFEKELNTRECIQSAMSAAIIISSLQQNGEINQQQYEAMLNATMYKCLSLIKEKNNNFSIN